MKKLKVVELFAGVGSQRMALRNIGVLHEVVAISEFDKFAIKSYEAIHGGVDNLGDITKIKSLPACDFLTYSFPCTDISVAGKMNGLSREGGTRSGLLWEVERLLKIYASKNELPKYLMLENVKNLIGKKFKVDFDEWLAVLDTLGYNSYCDVLNAKEYGIPQNRNRVFVISILKTIDIGYIFPNKIELNTKLADLLLDNVDEKYYMTHAKAYDLINRVKCDKQGKFPTNCITARYDSGIQDRQASGVAVIEKVVCEQRTDEGIRFFSGDYSGTLRTIDSCGDKRVLEAHTSEYKLRKLTPNECWRLMGFSDEDFKKAEAVNSNTQLYKQAGNSIVVNVLEAMYKNLFVDYK